MKKIISILLCSVLFITVNSNAQTAMTNPNGAAIDTVTNSTAEGPFLQVKGSAKTLSIVLPITKISGTVTGSIYWQGSNDGVSYATISSDTLTNATNVYKYKEVDKGYLYYKPLISPSGTSSISYKATLYTTSGR